MLIYFPLYQLSWLLLLSNTVKALEPDTFNRGHLSQGNKKHFPFFALIFTAPLSIKWKSVWITFSIYTDILWLLLTNTNDTDSYLDTRIKWFLCAVLLPFPESRLHPESQHQKGLHPVFNADRAIVFKPLTHYTLTTDEVWAPTHKLQVNSLRTKTRSILFCNLLYLVYRYITCLSVNCVPLNNTVLL